jgi:DNA polymerase-3 subunit alpha
VIEHIVEERERGGKFASMQDFMMRLSSKEVNKGTIESFIKAGAFDSLGGNRRQKMIVYPSMLDTVNREKKDNMSGQISLFDLGDEELSHANEIALPEIEEYEKEEFLSYEKEVLGIYISGHPLEDYANLLQKNSNCTSQDFVLEAEEDGEGGGMAKVTDGKNVIIGGMITSKTIKTTRSNTLMAFLTLEDMYGTVEIIVFPNVYERKRDLLGEDAKVFIRGRANVEEDKDGKIICQDIIPFENLPCELWLRLPNKKVFLEMEPEIYGRLSDYEGNDRIVVYLQEEKQMKQLPKSRGVNARLAVSQKALDGMSEVTVAIKERSLQT